MAWKNYHHIQRRCDPRSFFYQARKYNLLCERSWKVLFLSPGNVCLEVSSVTWCDSCLGNIRTSHGELSCYLVKNCRACRGNRGFNIISSLEAQYFGSRNFGGQHWYFLGQFKVSVLVVPIFGHSKSIFLNVFVVQEVQQYIHAMLVHTLLEMIVVCLLGLVGT